MTTHLHRRDVSYRGLVL